MLVLRFQPDVPILSLEEDTSSQFVGREHVVGYRLMDIIVWMIQTIIVAYSSSGEQRPEAGRNASEGRHWLYEDSHIFLMSNGDSTFGFL